LLGTIGGIGSTVAGAGRHGDGGGDGREHGGCGRDRNLGAGLAGLAAGLQLTAAGRHVQVLEASGGPGGRMRSDVVDGFTADRGFQELNTAHPELARLGVLDALPAAGPGIEVSNRSRDRMRAEKPRRRRGRRRTLAPCTPIASTT
jgi:hypothetical protein